MRSLAWQMRLFLAKDAEAELCAAEAALFSCHLLCVFGVPWCSVNRGPAWALFRYSALARGFWANCLFPCDLPIGSSEPPFVFAAKRAWSLLWDAKHFGDVLHSYCTAHWEPASTFLGCSLDDVQTSFTRHPCQTKSQVRMADYSCKLPCSLC